MSNLPMQFADSCSAEISRNPTRENLLALRIYEALLETECFEIQYTKHDTRFVATFNRGDDEILRAVVGTGETDGRRYAGIWICKRRSDSVSDWPASRVVDFEERFGFKASAGTQIIDWCVANTERVEELMQWFVGEASSEAAPTSINIEIDLDLRVDANKAKRIFGEVSGVTVGDLFGSRKELAEAGVHKPWVAGISGSKSDGADSIVMSGGYEDDRDYGDEVIYTGHGGNDPNTGRQVKDQEWERGNQGLRVSQLAGHPVRVIRGSGHRSEYSPDKGYRYDGLYRVEDSWMETGVSGFRICRFRLVRIKEEQSAPTPSSDEPTRRVATTVHRIVRNTRMALQVKAIHEDRCQVCGAQLVTPSGTYSEAAHIRPLGSPHDGPDALDNLLCLCPNCHVLFDYGALIVGEDFRVLCPADPQLDGVVLRLDHRHDVSSDALAYHRDRFS